MTSPTYVIVWRETPSPQARLRTYTAHDDQPQAYALADLQPAPSTILETQAAVDEYLLSDSVEPVAIPAHLAESVLGWDPAS